MKKLFYCLLFTSVMTSCKKDPFCDFSFSGILEAEETIQFENLSSNSDSFFWQFGDGWTSSERSTTHIYSKPGNYGVSLVARGNGKSASANKSIKITGTTYSITNNSTFTLYDFATFYWDGVAISGFVYFGTFDLGSTTNIVKTNSLFKFFAFRFVPDGDVYLSAHPFVLQPEQHNDLVIVNNH